MSLAEKFLSNEEQDLVVKAVKDAEMNTSGEVRVHIEDSCKEDLMDRAAFVFEQLKMHETKLRNGVLFYVSVSPKGFAILGDAGINKVVPDNFWDTTKDIVISQFKQGNFGAGLAQGVTNAGEILKKHFPYQADDVNELSDEISFGKN